jgi:hypothetical protein
LISLSSVFFSLQISQKNLNFALISVLGRLWPFESVLPYLKSNLEPFGGEGTLSGAKQLFFTTRKEKILTQKVRAIS